jgi:tRNA G10  N-methylase Trm11
MSSTAAVSDPFCGTGGISSDILLGVTVLAAKGQR